MLDFSLIISCFILSFCFYVTLTLIASCPAFMTALFIFPLYLFKSVFPSSFVSWSAFFHILLCTSCVCCLCFFPSSWCAFKRKNWLLLVVCLFTVCLFISIRFTDCLFNLLALSLAFGYFFMPKLKCNVKFYLRNQQSVYISIIYCYLNPIQFF